MHVSQTVDAGNSDVHLKYSGGGSMQMRDLYVKFMGHLLVKRRDNNDEVRHSERK